MRILAIETSCDETAAAVVCDGATVLSNVVSSQATLHSPYGGVVPELASREHLRQITSIVEAALRQASTPLESLDGLAVTRGPGLIGSLLVGVSFAKTLAYSLGRPLVSVNHLEGHLFSPLIEHPRIQFPAIGLIVSGGHTSLYWVPKMEEYRLLAQTRDDAAGEALDKLSKAVGLGYPGGPIIDRLSLRGNPDAFSFSVPKISDGGLDFSFSGFKTAALRYIRACAIPRVADPEAVPQQVIDLMASYQNAIVETLARRTESALRVWPARSILLTGGVACNSLLRKTFKGRIEPLGVTVYCPSPVYTTDNAAMIAAAAFPKFERQEFADLTLTADANLRLESIRQG
ncbi:MAG: tRNA (adenosine(37)-N6)-threonylcarbamoyltransferase complex transferase subunit TsaD [Acidobacteria bacterium]|nr:tRNA (adenosine(37)-N6)-threonylcarbamoyltransferase complex transferase subunit TsaD [Acidobacteriota bacterium]